MKPKRIITLLLILLLLSQLLEVQKRFQQQVEKIVDKYELKSFPEESTVLAFFSK